MALRFGFRKLLSKKLKVRQAVPLQVWTGCEVETPRICTQSAHEGGKVISRTHRPPLPPQERSLVLISVRG
jgi:hypothetical protein